jgi:hypothetical protein
MRNFFNNRMLAMIATFSILLMLGLNNYRDYGIGVDEPIERANGLISLRYIAKKFGFAKLEGSELLKPYHSTTLEGYKDRDYPVLFNLPAAFLEWTLNIKDEQEVYWLRHLLNYLVCLGGVFAIFRLAERRFNSWQYGILAVIFFITSPRFFAESYYNSKDLIFLAFFAIATNSLIGFAIQPSARTALLHGLATALAINVRIMGILFLFLTFFIFLVKLIKKEISLKLCVENLMLYFIFSALITYLLWPWLWESPVARIIEGFKNMAHFRLEMSITYLGEAIKSTKIPWHYVPVYIAVTTPVAYIFFFIVGLFAIINTQFSLRLRVWDNSDQLQDFIFITLLFIPLFAVIAMNSVLYNGWRQMYFIYPAFIMMSIRGFNLVWLVGESNLLLSRFLRPLIFTAVLIAVLVTSVWMIRVHPFQNLYFNSLAGVGWNTKFEIDYWALTHQRALKWILDNDDRSVIRVAGIWQDVLPNHERARIAKVDHQFDADFLVDGSGPDFFKTGEIFHDGKEITVISKRLGAPIRLEPIKLEEEVFFGSMQKGVQYLLAVGNQSLIGWGWSNPESWGVWSDGYQAKLLLTLPEKPVRNLVLVLHPLIGAKQPIQNIKVSINRHDAGFYKLVSPKSIVTIPMSENMTDRNYLEVLFQISNPISPRELLLGNDDRKLGFGLVSLHFE